METWQFEPIEQDGKPVVASTSVRMALSAVPDGEDTLQLRLDKVWFGEPKGIDKTTPPKYPPQALRDRIAARVLLTLQLDENGKVVDALPYQTNLSRSSSEGRDARYRRYFENASIKAAMHWTFTPGEMIDGVKLGASVMVPITYSLGSRMAPDSGWRGYYPGPVTPAPWSNSAALAAVDSAELEDGQAAAVDSRFHLKTPVAGTIL
jgi:hypothetical protein